MSQSTLWNNSADKLVNIGGGLVSSGDYNGWGRQIAQSAEARFGLPCEPDKPYFYRGGSDPDKVLSYGLARSGSRRQRPLQAIGGGMKHGFSCHCLPPGWQYQPKNHEETRQCTNCIWQFH